MWHFGCLNLKLDSTVREEVKYTGEWCACATFFFALTFCYLMRLTSIPPHEQQLTNDCIIMIIVMRWHTSVLIIMPDTCNYIKVDILLFIKHMMSHCIKDQFWSYYDQGFKQTPNPKSGSKIIVFFINGFRTVWTSRKTQQQKEKEEEEEEEGDLHLWLWHLFLLNLFPEHGVEKQRSSAVMDQSRGLLQCVQIRDLCADTHQTHSKRV